MTHLPHNRTTLPAQSVCNIFFYLYCRQLLVQRFQRIRAGRGSRPCDRWDQPADWRGGLYNHIKHINILYGKHVKLVVIGWKEEYYTYPPHYTYIYIGVKSGGGVVTDLRPPPHQRGIFDKDLTKTASLYAPVYIIPLTLYFSGTYFSMTYCTIGLFGVYPSIHLNYGCNTFLSVWERIIVWSIFYPSFCPSSIY